MVDFKAIPIFIVSFNRLDCLKKQISYFESKGYTNLHIVDNASTYKPLLEYLKSSPYKVYFLKENLGHKVVFECPEFKEIISKNYFVVTDPDVIPVEECPDDFVEVFYDVLKAHKDVTKVGFSLKIDDLPNHYALKNEVIKWESIFYKNSYKYKNKTIYEAILDTTFALYRPYKETRDFLKALRVGYPYEARHLPWYCDLSKPTEEDVFYNNLDKGCSNWGGKLSDSELQKKYDYKYIESIKVQFLSMITVLDIYKSDTRYNLKLLFCSLIESKKSKLGRNIVKICKIPVCWR